MGIRWIGGREMFQTIFCHREAELGLALMFASMIPIYWRRTEA
jgi:hypothetical protein